VICVRPKIAITTGDADGIGYEVSLKALEKIGSDFPADLYLYRPAHFAPPAAKSYLVDCPRTDSPVDWIEEATIKSMQNDYSGIVTGPISKTLIQSTGRKDIGHTDIFRRLSSVKNVFMSFFGDQFNVLLATGHIPLDQVFTELTEERLRLALQHCMVLRQWLEPKKQNLPVGLLGLNPHASDEGLLGSFENEFLNPLISKLSAEGLPVRGPLVPDAAFAPETRDQLSFFIALYHDQGLIPFKAVHGYSSGVHVSSGLPFVRTSVDHGTAKDIFGKNCANSSSMYNAILWANRMCAHKLCEVSI
jgi:4-hydroxythreonine-4-phosphate dehydrogenase